MDEPLEDRNLASIEPLVPPCRVKAELPADAEAARLVLRTRAAIRDVLHGRDMRRLVVLVGPCSINDAEAAVDYAGRLRRVANATAGEMILVMRTYFSKPRTTVGWKGLINDPRLDGSCDIAAGLRAAREILLRIHRLGVPCGSEVLDPIAPQYLADLLSWAAIGARTAESQVHREIASGLSMPVGFKNSTTGSLAAARDAMVVARHPHSFLGIDCNGVTCVVRTRGNPDRHLILRGGDAGPNYGPADVARAASIAAGEGIARGVMVDCSHGNSGRDHRRQAGVCRSVLQQVRAGQRAILGLMLESNLQPGRQDWQRTRPLAYGVSVTDGCLGWDETEELLGEIAAAVRAAASEPVRRWPSTASV